MLNFIIGYNNFNFTYTVKYLIQYQKDLEIFHYQFFLNKISFFKIHNYRCKSKKKILNIFYGSITSKSCFGINIHVYKCICKYFNMLVFTFRSNFF